MSQSGIVQEKIVFVPLDQNVFSKISGKANEFRELIPKFINLKNQKRILKYNEMAESTISMNDIIIQNIDFINESKSFQGDFDHSIQIINTAYEAYLKAINYVIDSKQQKSAICHNLQISINNFAKSIKIFATTIMKVLNLKQSKDLNQFQLEMINMRIGLECSLFNFSVNIEQTNEEPFYKSRFVEIYKCYKKINKKKNKIIAIQSVCCTGKTLCLPIILLCKSLKNNIDVPFLIITQPSSIQIERNEKFFQKTISKYANVISDEKQFLDIYKEYDKTKKITKVVLALFLPNQVLSLMHQLQNDESFYSCTRFIIDEIHQRPFFYDVLISQFAELNNKLQIFTLPLNLVLMSATIPPKILRIFNEKIKTKKLVKSHPFEIIEQEPIIESCIPKINKEIIPNQTINVIENMAKSNIEEGHILCFLSEIKICYNIRNTIISSLKNSEENEDQRKIIPLETSLKPNEKIESYLRRLKEEYLLNESLRNENDYKKDFLYIVPIVLSDTTENSVLDLCRNDFPEELKRINKLIFSTPLIETSFTINRLSVVIDSGITKETDFDCETCLSTLTQEQLTKESMNQRKGRLGRTMNGLYIPIHQFKDDQIYDFKLPPVKRTDLTTNILILKDIGLDFENMKKLPSNPNQKNLHFSINALKKMKAIDSETLKITKFGHELLKYVYDPYISVYYAAAIISFRDSFPDNKNYATFIAAFITTIIAMDYNLIQEEKSEKMSRCFSEESDITTIVKSLKKLIKSELTDNDQLRDLVESYGFSYTNYLAFLSHIQEIVNLFSPDETVSSYLEKCKGFININGKISGIVDRLIPEIAKVTPNWKNVHSIRYKYANGAGNFNSAAIIVFNADKSLIFDDKHQKSAEIRITKRPGWNGIMIPTECFCFNIIRNSTSNINYGHLVHRKDTKSKGEIASVECDKNALNPWFNVLLDAYLEGSSLNIKYFTNLVKTNANSKNKGQNTNQHIIEKRMFHYSNAGERVFVSFIPCDENVKKIIENSINLCLELMPFTPRSILIYRKDCKSIIEITSIGTQHYETSISSLVPGRLLDRKGIDFCLKNIKELAKSTSSIRICALFTKQTCESDFYDTKKLYLINEKGKNWPTLQTTVQKMIDELRPLQQEANKRHLKQKEYKNKSNGLKLFQFPPRFIHPALLHHQQSRECILKWFSDHCDYAKIVKIIGHRFLMKQEEIQRLQEHVRYDKENMIQEMNLNYVAIPVPLQVYSRGYSKIREHPTWLYNNRFKVIIALKEEAETIKEFIQSIKDELIKENPNDKSAEFTETLSCLYVCDDPDNPVLTKYPITIYYEDGSTYTNKMCRDCIADTLHVATESFFNDGKIDQNALYKISVKPSIIPSVESKEIKGGLECWPQIPLGQMISALINNDDEMRDLISAWLQGISEFAVRVAAKDLFSFCPDHPFYIFNLKLRGNRVFKCKEEECINTYCEFCLSWHDPSFICQPKKDGKALKWDKICPKCKSPTFKDGGCNHIACPCGCHWCYKCGKGFSTSDQCYNHMSTAHGGCFDYENFD